MHVYPNPIQADFKVALGTRYESIDLQIVNQQGHPLLSRHFSDPGKVLEVSVAELQLNPGIYFLTLRSGGELVGKTQLIKQ